MPPNLLLSKINTTEIYVPDIKLQNQFSAFVEQTDKSKFEYEKSLNEMKNLLYSLMNKYFN